MFINIGVYNEKEYINLNHVRHIYLLKEKGNPQTVFKWIFVFDDAHQVESYTFMEEWEALEWFQQYLKPFLDEYYSAKISAPLDIAQFTENIAVVLEELKEKQEV